MSDSIEVRHGGTVSPDVDYIRSLADTAAMLAEASKAKSTRARYGSAWRVFSAWCDRLGLQPLPAKDPTLRAYIAHLEQISASPSTVGVHMSAIKWKHGKSGIRLERTPALDELIDGHLRRHGKAPQKQARDITVKELGRLVALLDPTVLRDVRDRAIILIGFSGGWRCSELVGIDLAQIREAEKGLSILLPRSKADQYGEGKSKVAMYGSRIETCPVTAYQRWKSLSGVTAGRLFRAINRHGKPWGSGLSPQTITDIVRARALAAGLPDDEKAPWSAHTLRRGFATVAARNGVPRHQIMEDGGWGSSAVDVYIKAGTEFDDRAASKLGL